MSALRKGARSGTEKCALGTEQAKSESDRCGKRTGKTAAHGVVNPDVLVQFLPAERPSLYPEEDFFEQILRRICQQRIASGWEADHSLVIEFQPNTAALHPAAHAGGRAILDHVFSGDHGNECKPQAILRNGLQRDAESHGVPPIGNHGWMRTPRDRAKTLPPDHLAQRGCAAARHLHGCRNGNGRNQRGERSAWTRVRWWFALGQRRSLEKEMMNSAHALMKDINYGKSPRRFFASHTRLMPRLSAAMRMETFSCFA